MTPKKRAFLMKPLDFRFSFQFRDAEFHVLPALQGGGLLLVEGGDARSRGVEAFRVLRTYPL